MAHSLRDACGDASAAAPVPNSHRPTECSSFNHVPAGKDLPQDFNVIIEIPAQSDPVKYEADKELGLLVVDRFIGTGMRYPVNYGYIPQTLSGDGDPVDVLVITPFPLLAGSIVRSRVLGMLQMTDESGVDAKLVAVPHDKVCPMTANLKSIDDVPEYLKDQIKHFFEQYKALEKGKWVKVEGWAGIEAAHKKSPTAQRTTRSGAPADGRFVRQPRVSPQEAARFCLRWGRLRAAATGGGRRVGARGGRSADAGGIFACVRDEFAAGCRRLSFRRIGCVRLVLTDVSRDEVFCDPIVVGLLALCDRGGFCRLGRLGGFAGLSTFSAFPAFPAFFGLLPVSTVFSARSTFFAFFRPRAPAFNPTSSPLVSTATTAGSTDSSVRNPAASSRFCTAVSCFTQYSARDALDRSGSGNDASTARGLRERV